MAFSLIQQTGEAGDQTCNLWFTRRVAYPHILAVSRIATDTPSEREIMKNKIYFSFNNVIYSIE